MVLLDEMKLILTKRGHFLGVEGSWRKFSLLSCNDKELDYQLSLVWVTLV